jgi:hypothetical protein
MAMLSSFSIPRPERRFVLHSSLPGGSTSRELFADQLNLPFEIRESLDIFFNWSTLCSVEFFPVGPTP